MRPAFLAACAVGLSNGVPGAWADRLPAWIDQAEPIQPRAISGVELHDGKLRISTAVQPYSPGRRDRIHIACAYDMYEGAIDTNGDGVLDAHAPNAPPWDLPEGECQKIPNGARYYLGSSYINPFASNDLEAPWHMAGRCADFVDFSLFWNGDGHGGADNLVVALLTSEDWSACADDGATSAYPGVAYQFGSVGATGRYRFSNINLLGSELCHQIPLDGSGGMLLFILRYEDSDSDGLADDVDGDGVADFLLPTHPGGGQPMLWGAGADSYPWDSRCGDQDAAQFDDDNPRDGRHDSQGVECYDYTGSFCVVPLCASVGLWCAAICSCAGDLNSDDAIDLGDLALMISALGDPYRHPCADIDENGEVALSDLSAMLSRFGSRCP